MPFKELVFFADVKRKVAKTHRHTSAKNYHGNFYTSPCLFIAFENFQIRCILHAKVEVFYINVKMT